MQLTQLLNQITPDIYQRLKRAIETGKWPNGNALTQQQKELTMQAIIHYDHQHLADTQRVGYIDKGDKKHGETCSDTPQPAPLKWS